MEAKHFFAVVLVGVIMLGSITASVAADKDELY